MTALRSRPQGSSAGTVRWRVRAVVRQCRRMSQQQQHLIWPLATGTEAARLCWQRLGSVRWLEGAAHFPQAPEDPGVYLVKLSIRDQHRIYIGEAANLRKRLRRYGGRGVERPPERGKTTTNMRGRVRRVMHDDGGSVEVYLLQLPIDSGYAMCDSYPKCKDCRIMIERVAIATAYLRHEPLINEHGFPRSVSGDPLE